MCNISQINITPISRGSIFGLDSTGPFGWVSERNLTFLLEMGGLRKSEGSNFLWFEEWDWSLFISTGLWVDFPVKSRIVAGNKKSGLN